MADRPIVERYRGGQSDLDAPLVQFANLLRLLFVPLGVLALVNGGVTSLAVVVVAAAFALLPTIIELVQPIRLSGIVHVAAVGLPLVEIAGRTLALYENSPVPYDVFSHFLGMASVTALVLLFAADRLESLRWRRRPVVVALLGAAIGLAVGVAWELVELVVEPLFSGRLVHGMDDTLLDLLADVAGAVAASLLVVAYWRVDKTRDI